MGVSKLKYKATQRYSFGWVADLRPLEERHLTNNYADAMKKNKQQRFAITSGQGFQITFQNGWMLSVQFGAGHYCDRRTKTDIVKPGAREVWDSPDAECAIRSSSGALVEWPKEFGGTGDTIRGWVTPNELVPVVLWVAMQE